nr:hypothetical protein [Bacteroides intestinalis]
MKTYLILICVLLVSINGFGQNTPRVYSVKYFYSSDGGWVSDDTTLSLSTNRIVVQRGSSTKSWECEYKGVRTRQVDKNTSFKYHYYLTKDNIKLIVSDYKEVKHNGVFYYRIVFNGQTLLAL